MPIYFYSGKIFKDGNVFSGFDGMVEARDAREAKRIATEPQADYIINKGYRVEDCFVHFEQFNKVE